MKFGSSLPPSEFIVEGVSGFAEYLRHKPQAVKRVFATAKYKDKVRNLIASHNIPFSLIEEKSSAHPKDRFQPESPVYAHVEIHYQSFSNLTKLLQKSNSQNLILALDHITDPRNLGAIARSAAFFGVKYILVPKMRQVLLTNASVSSSQGAFAYSELVLVPNLSQALEKLKEQGFWILCADAAGEPFEKLVHEYQKVVLLLGSEGSGVSDLLKKRSDRMIAIGSSQSQILDSLNVSVAAGILLNGFASSQVPRSNS